MLGISCLLAVALAASNPAPVSPDHVAMADHYSQAHRGLALVIAQGAKTICDDHAGLSDDAPARIYSGTKNFVAITVLIAAQRGLLSLDEPASQTLTEWKHDRRRSITIRQLLNQTSGLDPAAGMINDARDQMAAAVRARLRATPGSQFHYGPSNYQAISEILQRKLARQGISVETYMHRVLLDPLDIDVPIWAHDRAGHPLLHAGMQLTTTDWLKFGKFIINHGAMGRGAPLLTPASFNALFVGTSANPAYGLSFWLNRAEQGQQPMRDLQPAMDGEQLYAGGPRDTVAAEGTDKQRLYIIPSRGLVIVRFAAGGHFSDQDFLSRLLTGTARPDARSH